MNKDLVAIFDYMEKEKGIKREIVARAIEDALRAAARKGLKDPSNVDVAIDSKSGQVDVFAKKTIVENVTNPEKEISLDMALELNEYYELGQIIDVDIMPKNFGRIAAQTARQIINQKLKSAERDVIYEEYRHRIDELVSGTVKRFVRGSDVIVDLGKVEALMPSRQYPRSEKYHVGDRVLALLMDVQDTDMGGAEVILSRSSPNFVKRLLIQEVPEIADATVIIDKIVREAGYRTKLTVRSTDPKVDPVGACVGMRGNRVKNIVRELNNEKIDIIPYSEDPIILLQNALSPVEIKKISIDEGERVISIVVDDEDFPVVIGKKGLNARLNGQLIDAEISVQRMSEYRKALSIEKYELAHSDSPYLDEPLSIEHLNKLVIENIIDAGFDTPRKFLMADPEELLKVPGLSGSMTDDIIEEIRKRV